MTLRFIWIPMILLTWTAVLLLLEDWKGLTAEESKLPVMIGCVRATRLVVLMEDVWMYASPENNSHSKSSTYLQQADRSARIKSAPRILETAVTVHFLKHNRQPYILYVHVCFMFGNGTL